MLNIHEWHLTRVSSTMQMIFYWDLGKKVIDRFIFEKLVEYTCFFYQSLSFKDSKPNSW